MKRLGIAALIAWACFAAPSLADIDVGEQIPDALGYDLEGEKILSADLEGKIVVLTFWATWCAPCLEELPILNAIQHEVSEDDLRVIAVNFRQTKRQFRKTTDALKSFKLQFVYDRRNRLVRKFGVNALPHLFIIGRDGSVLLEKTGYSKKSLPGLVDAINAALMDEPLPGR